MASEIFEQRQKCVRCQCSLVRHSFEQMTIKYSSVQLLISHLASLPPSVHRLTGSSEKYVEDGSLYCAMFLFTCTLRYLGFTSLSLKFNSRNPEALIMCKHVCFWCINEIKWKGFKCQNISELQIQITNTSYFVYYKFITEQLWQQCSEPLILKWYQAVQSSSYNDEWNVYRYRTVNGTSVLVFILLL